MPIDLRSDTITLPTERMRHAMAAAPVGDDVYQEDPTVNELERLAAKRLGKPAALFTASGTMGNQLALGAHARRGDEIIAESTSHIVLNEVGAAAALWGLQTYTIPAPYGILNAEQIEAAIRESDLHHPDTGLICLENTHNSGGGTVYPLQTMADIHAVAQKRGVPVHIDGARIFNAAAALNVPVADIAQYADSVSFCLSKGLSAPVGSVLVGGEAFIGRARKLRKMLGGGMRQAGIIAAAGIIALEEMTGRLQEDHQNARRLADGLNAIDGIEVDLRTVQTNIVFANLTRHDAKAVVQALAQRDILLFDLGSRIRMVLHRHITASDVERTIEAFRDISAH